MTRQSKFVLFGIAALWALTSVISACGTAQGGGGGGFTAQEISGPGGVRCFVILSGGGTAVGGNCN